MQASWALRRPSYRPASGGGGRDVPVRFSTTPAGHPRRRVDLGGYPPRPPTDPYVRDYRIRFLRSQVRYASSDLMTDFRVGQWIALQQKIELCPFDLGVSRAATEPLAPDPPDPVS